MLPKNTWLREGLADLLDEVLSAERLSLHGYFNRDYISALISNFLKGDDALTFKIWTLIVFQLWYEDYLNVNSSTDISLFAARKLNVIRDSNAQSTVA